MVRYQRCNPFNFTSCSIDGALSVTNNNQSGQQLWLADVSERFLMRLGGERIRYYPQLRTCAKKKEKALEGARKIAMQYWWLAQTGGGVFFEWRKEVPQTDGSTDSWEEVTAAGALEVE